MGSVAKSRGQKFTAFEAIRTTTYFLLDYGVREFERGVSGRRPNDTSKRMRPVPMAMAEPATLKAGQMQGLKHTSKKPGTTPCTVQAAPLTVGPPSRRARDAT